MKRKFILLIGLILTFLFTACASTSINEEKKVAAAPQEKVGGNTMTQNRYKVKISVNGKELIAELEDNATTRAFVQKMPVELPMQDLYGREMCYRYGSGGLPTDKLRSDGYAVGDIAYWPPRGSLVILYSQNGEEFQRQHLGHINSGVEVFKSTGDARVKFELMK